MNGPHTPGPWRWEINREHRSINLVGGRPTFDKTVMQFCRWGMQKASPMFNEAIAGDRYNIMTKVAERPDWIAPFPGRDHHASWCANVTHPDARLIAAAPDLLAALQAVVTELDEGDGNAPGHGHTTPGVWDDDNGTLSGTACTWCAQWSQAKAAIAKATGDQP